LLRGQMLAQRQSDYVLAATSVGVRRRRIVLGHILPNSLTPVIVQGTLTLATAIVDAAGLAFLGLSSNDPSIPEWGRMLADTQRYLSSARQAGQQAAQAGSGHLVLTHLLPGTDHEAARVAARTGYDGDISVATAGLVLNLH